MSNKIRIAFGIFLVLVLVLSLIGYSYGLSFDRRGEDLGNFMVFSTFVSLVPPIIYLKEPQ